jgi:hypothetical protein
VFSKLNLRYFVQGDIVISNPDHFLTILREVIYPSDDKSQARPAISDLERSTRWLREKLKIAQRTLPKFEGDFRVQFGKFVERIIPFDNELPVELARGKSQMTRNTRVLQIQYGADKLSVINARNMAPTFINAIK